MTKRVVSFDDSFVARVEGEMIQPEGWSVGDQPSEVNDPQTPRGIMVDGGRKRKKDWSYSVVTDDWPAGIGTESQSLSREARYAVLRSFGPAYAKAMDDLAKAKPEDVPQVSKHPQHDVSSTPD